MAFVHRNRKVFHLLSPFRPISYMSSGALLNSLRSLFTKLQKCRWYPREIGSSQECSVFPIYKKTLNSFQLLSRNFQDSSVNCTSRAEAERRIDRGKVFPLDFPSYDTRIVGHFSNLVVTCVSFSEQCLRGRTKSAPNLIIYKP